MEEVGADSDHHINITGLNQRLAYLGFITSGAGRLRGHDKPCPPAFIQIAVEIADPDVIAVGYLALFIRPRQSEGQARILLYPVSIDLIHVERGIGHHEISLAEQFVRVAGRMVVAFFSKP